jgi:predicted nucleotidyltransferase
MTLEQLTQESRHLLLKCISGSRAYNLSLPTSDTDIKGIFILPQEEIYGLTYTEQVANASNDEVFFEIGRFIDLLSKNNPNILELLSTPKSCVLFRHPLMDLIKPEDFLSKLCLDTFAGYAKTQIRKAWGLNKKINQSFEKERKSVLEFCYVVKDNGTLPLNEWLLEMRLVQEDCGLVNLSHFRDAYLLYHQKQVDEEEKLKGIVSAISANDVQLSSVPKGTESLGIMYFNKDAYSIYCREYNEYWQWVEKRNDERYQSTLSHGKSYDAKHMMHTFRLLNMAAEIAIDHRVIVHREDRDFLLQIRRGEFEYEELMQMVEKKMAHIEQLYMSSALPEAPDPEKAGELLIRIRKEFYK